MEIKKSIFNLLFSEFYNFQVLLSFCGVLLWQILLLIDDVFSLYRDVLTLIYAVSLPHC